MTGWKQEYDGSLEGVPAKLPGGVEVDDTHRHQGGGVGGVVNLKTRSAFTGEGQIQLPGVLRQPRDLRHA